MKSWRNDLNRSNAAFMDLVWPAISGVCGGGEIRPVEVMTDDISRDLDMLCGIDVWQTISGAGCRGIASRVQFGPKNWRTFTIRKSRDSGAQTEYSKRKEAIEGNGKFLYPYLTCQAYVDDDKLIAAAVAKTKSVFAAIAPTAPTRRTNNASFFVIPWAQVDGVKTF